MLSLFQNKQNLVPKKYLIDLLPAPDKRFLEKLANLSNSDKIPGLVEAIMALPNEEALDVAGTLLQLRFQADRKFQNKDLVVALIRAFLYRSSFPLSDNNRAKLQQSDDRTLLQDVLALFASPSPDFIRFFLPLYQTQTQTWGGQAYNFTARMWPLFYHALIGLEAETRIRIQKIAPQLILKDQEWLSPLFHALGKGSPSKPEISANTLKRLRDIYQPQHALKKDEALIIRIEELTDIADFLAEEFPAGSPLAKEFLALKEALTQCLEDFTQKRIPTENANSKTTELIAPYVNIGIAHLTPLQRLSIGNPSLTEEELTRFVNRLVAEGGDIEATTTNYPASWQMRLKDAWQGIPWPRLMATPLLSKVPKSCAELAFHFEPRLTPLLSNFRKQKAQESVSIYVPPEEWAHEWSRVDENNGYERKKARTS